MSLTLTVVKTNVVETRSNLSTIQFKSFVTFRIKHTKSYLNVSRINQNSDRNLIAQSQANMNFIKLLLVLLTASLANGCFFHMKHKKKKTTRSSSTTLSTTKINDGSGILDPRIGINQGINNVFKFSSLRKK